MAGARLPWLSRWLFRLTVGLSAVLIALVLFSPLLDNEVLPPDGLGAVVALFAQDVTVRRTAVASALGLLVTACVFFRPTAAPQPVTRKRRRSGPPPPAGAAGA